MALWGEFGKRAGETARSFGNRAREVAETTKLNGQIAVRKTEAERLYADIGKAYCDARAGRNSGEGDMDALCLKVEALNKEIEALQAEIDAIRQVRRCKTCGEVSSTNSRFCGACGAKFEDIPVEQADPKPAPAEAVQPEADEGVEITWPEVAPASEPAPEQPVAPDEPAPEDAQSAPEDSDVEQP